MLLTSILLDHARHLFGLHLRCEGNYILGPYFAVLERWRPLVLNEH